MPIGTVRVRYAVAIARKEFGPDTTARTIIVPRVGDVRIRVGVGRPPPRVSTRAIAVLAAVTTRIDMIGSFPEKLIVVDRLAN